jgi:hypothetical protein
MRYLEWDYDPDPADSTFFTDYAYLLREADGRVHIEHDRHILGLFGRADWLRLITAAGFEARILPFEHSEVEPGTMELFLGLKR